MKYCSKCGQELPDDVAFCTGCGCPVEPPQAPQYNQPQYNQPQYNQPQYNQPQYNQPQYNQPQYNQPQYNQPQYGQPPYNQSQPESSGLAIAAIVCAILVPLVGLILGIVGMSKYKDPQLKQKSQGAIFISLGVWLVSFVVLMAMSQI